MKNISHKFSILFLLLVPAAVGLLAGTGCRQISIWSKDKPAEEKVAQEPEEKKKAFFVGDIVSVDNVGFIEVTSVSLVTNLAGTGSDPPQSQYRTFLLREMASQDVAKPNAVLADPRTSLVVVTGYLPPAVQKGDRFDLDVSVPADSETTSLRGGYLLSAPLREICYMEGVREGKKFGVGSGPVLIEPRTGTDRDKVTQVRGVVLGGGVSHVTLPVRLIVKQHLVKTDIYQTMKIESAINRRFQVTGPNGLRQNVAKAKDDRVLEILIPPKYKDNKTRFLQVVRCLPIIEPQTQRMARLEDLQKRLQDPETSRRAALELEAIGQSAVETLKTGLESADASVRFYSAQSLAYLDESCAAQELGRVALNDRENRAFALSALSALDDLYAYEELRKLMNAPVAEARYGAFRALSAMRPEDPLVKGETLGKDSFKLCVVPSDEKPMLHVRKTEKAEIVLFGENQEFAYPFLFEAANNIVIRAESETRMSVVKFTPNQPDKRKTTSMQTADVIRALAEVGATYPDIIEILQEAINQGALSASFRIDSIPQVRK
ncbi:MAG: flagellar basal body P-ring protein FlgI [Planctomycetia bacterium]|nr:flagellar basal body P-ring protein FlgI [Planctomycetia bacterium]